MLGWGFCCCVTLFGISMWNKEYLSVISLLVQSRLVGIYLPHRCLPASTYLQLSPVTHWEHPLPSFDLRKIYNRDGWHSETTRQCSLLANSASTQPQEFTLAVHPGSCENCLWNCSSLDQLQMQTKTTHMHESLFPYYTVTSSMQGEEMLPD